MRYTGIKDEGRGCIKIFMFIFNVCVCILLLFYHRSFRSVGDEIFIQAFEDATLPFEDWTHEAHLRMAWNYITEHGKEGAIPHIRLGEPQKSKYFILHCNQGIIFLWISCFTLTYKLTFLQTCYRASKDKIHVPCSKSPPSSKIEVISKH